MTKLDEMIEDALRDQDRAILEATKEQGWFALGFNQFRGKLGWVTWLIMVAQLSFFALAVWCGYHFFNSDDVLIAQRWGLSAAVLAVVATQLKLSLMPQMQADRILRELKRVELIMVRKKE